MFEYTLTAKIFQHRALITQKKAFEAYRDDYERALKTNNFDTKKWLKKYGHYPKLRQEIIENDGFRKGLRSRQADELVDGMFAVLTALYSDNIHLARKRLTDYESDLKACKWLCKDGHSLLDILERDADSVKFMILEAIIIHDDQPLRDNERLSSIINPKYDY